MRYPGGLIATTPVNQQYPSGVWTGPQTTPYQTNNVWGVDSSFRNTTLLLHGDGATTSFTRDASTNNFQLSLVGDTKPNNLTPFVQNGYWSNYFDGSGDYLTSSHPNLNATWTFECWVYRTVSSTQQVLVLFNSGSFSGAVVYIESTNYLTVNDGVNFLGSFTGATVPVNAWTHIAVVRSGGTTTGYVNGVSVGTNTFTPASVNAINVSYYYSGAPLYFTGHISNLRVVNGSAVYTGNFTPPTAPLTAITNTSFLTCQSNRFIDNSSNAYTITKFGDTAVSIQQPFTAPSGTSQYGSGYFDGSGDYLTVPSSSAFAFGTGDFTVECWAYFTSVANFPTLTDSRVNTSSTAGFNLGLSGARVQLYTTSQLLIGATTLVANAWYHIAVTRLGTTLRIWLNGVQDATTTNSTNWSDPTLVIGATPSGVNAMTGYISNTRLIKGTAVYTSAFTPPTAPLTPVTNTSLLTLQTNGPENNNGFLDGSANSFPITRTGNTTQGSFTPYGPNGYWSNSFTPNSGVQFPYTSALTSWWTQNFTMEMWVFNNTNAVSGTNSLALQFAHGVYTSASTYWAFGTNASGQVDFYYYNGTQNRVTSTASALLGTWNHIAMVYTHSTANISLYLNGVSVASATKSGTPQNDASNTVNLGAVQGVYYNGYISNLRVLNGTALYTTTFTPPTAPLTAITNTQLLTSQSNRFRDNSTNNATPTLIGTPSIQAFQPFTPAVQYTPSTLGGSGYFDGSGDYLTVASNAQTAPQSNNFTIELWVYLTNPTANALQTFYTNYTNFNSAGSIYFGKHTINGGTVAVWLSTYSTGGPLLVESTFPPGNQWVHYALVRNGNTFSLYRNGALSTSSTAFTGAATPATNPNFIGAAGDAVTSYNLPGYISDFRIVNGTAVYTGAFTPPTAPLTPIAGTQLLLPMNNAAIFDNSGMNNLETVGNAQIDTSVVKYGTGSMAFDGSGDYLQAPNNPNYQMGSGNFTIEMWLYIPSLPSAYKRVFSLTNTSVSSATDESVNMEITNTNKMVGTVTVSTTYNSVTDSSDIPTNVWTHWAFVRNGSTLALYRDGISVSTASVSGSANWGTGFNLYIGRWVGSSARDYNGYIDDLRITKGVARYVTNFTPPVARMPNQ